MSKGDRLYGDGYDTEGTGNKRKNRQIEVHENFKILYIKNTVNRVNKKHTKWDKIFQTMSLIRD